MVRRKALRYARLAAFTRFYSPTAKDYMSIRDYYNRRYEEVDKKY